MSLLMMRRRSSPRLSIGRRRESRADALQSIVEQTAEERFVEHLESEKDVCVSFDGPFGMRLKFLRASHMVVISQLRPRSPACGQVAVGDVLISWRHKKSSEIVVAGKVRDGPAFSHLVDSLAKADRPVFLTFRPRDLAVLGRSTTSY